MPAPKKYSAELRERAVRIPTFPQELVLTISRSLHLEVVGIPSRRLPPGPRDGPRFGVLRRRERRDWCDVSHPQCSPRASASPSDRGRPDYGELGIRMLKCLHVRGLGLAHKHCLPNMRSPPGVGKTMLSVALGRAAVDAGHRVYITTAAELATKCHKAALEGRWKTCMRFFAGPKLLITDLCRARDYAEHGVRVPGEGGCRA